MNDIERVLGRVLAVGVALSTLALAAGLAVAGISGSGQLSTRLLSAGIVLLIGTPVARVAVSTVEYARRRDWLFTVLTLIVLGELVASIIAAVRS